jgi:hypothetical protein
MVGLSLAAACTVLAVMASPVFAWGVGTFSAGDERLLLSLTNQDRASAGLNVLVNDSYLHTKAEWRAKDMGDRNYFSHQIPPDNKMVFSYMQSDGYCFKVAGENIGLSTWSDDVATNRIEKAFMGSTSHRANILGSWARIGVGAYKAPDGRKLYAVLFSIPCGVKVPTPTPVVTPPPVIVPTKPPTPAPTVSVLTLPPTPVLTLPPTPVLTLPPTPVLTLPPTTSPTLSPETTPTPEATASPSVTEGPSATASETPTPTYTSASTASAVPNATSTPPPTSTIPAPTAAPSGSPASVAVVPSLRVRERTVSQGPLESLFQSFFGGLFGW